MRPPSLALVMEFCEGGSLKTNLMKYKWQWNTESKIKACLQAAQAVRHIHQYNVIHRDIKAENFFVAANNVLKLGDFGESTKIIRKAKKRMTVLGTVGKCPKSSS